MKYKAFLEERSMKARESPPRSGPNTYFAVQVVPKGQTKLKALNSNIAAQRGIDIIYCGSGYSNRTTLATSQYNVAKSKAQKIVDIINQKGEYYGPRNFS